MKTTNIVQKHTSVSILTIKKMPLGEIGAAFSFSLLVRSYVLEEVLPFRIGSLPDK
ncbi:MAG: hypothetical protein AB7V11_01785 [Pyrinomonadaceae bacterium]